MNSQQISNGKVNVLLRYASETTELAHQLMTFIAPYFSAQAAPGTADYELCIQPSADFTSAMRAQCEDRVNIRVSTAEQFNLSVKVGGRDGVLLAWDDKREVGYIINPEKNHVRFFGGHSAFVHLIEFFRYYGLLIEQSKGSVVLHSSAVIDRDHNHVIALVGRKGSGKTTTLLALTESGQYEYFSGDKLLLDIVDGEIRARGWPDYPHVGIGTLKQHPSLARSLKVDLHEADGSEKPDSHKVLIDPVLFRQHVKIANEGVGRLSKIILPDVLGSPSLRKLEADDKKSIPHQDLFEWPHEFVAATWHELRPAGLTLEKNVPVPLASLIYALPWEQHSGGASRQGSIGD
ncbi:hypothetical protein KV580_13480 [Pseudomonas chlororaphis]|nr:hypothetical protein [Pseudomonas chlororaphis]